MRPEVLNGFADEMEKIALRLPWMVRSSTVDPRAYEQALVKKIQQEAKEKVSGFMQNLGTRIMWSPTGRTAQAVMKNPVEATKRGIMSSFRDPRTGKVGFMRPGQRFNQSLLLGGTAMAGASALKKDDPDQIGAGRAERVGKFLGGTALGFAAAPYGGLMSGIAAGIGGEYAGGKVGKLVDRARGYKAKKGPEAEAILRQRLAAKQQAQTPAPAVAPAQPIQPQGAP